MIQVTDSFKKKELLHELRLTSLEVAKTYKNDVLQNADKH